MSRRNNNYLTRAQKEVLRRMVAWLLGLSKHDQWSVKWANAVQQAPTFAMTVVALWNLVQSLEARRSSRWTDYYWDWAWQTYRGFAAQTTSTKIMELVAGDVIAAPAELDGHRFIRLAVVKSNPRYTADDKVQLEVYYPDSADHDTLYHGDDRSFFVLEDNPFVDFLTYGPDDMLSQNEDDQDFRAFAIAMSHFETLNQCDESITSDRIATRLGDDLYSCIDWSHEPANVEGFKAYRAALVAIAWFNKYGLVAADAVIRPSTYRRERGLTECGCCGRVVGPDFDQDPILELGCRVRFSDGRENNKLDEPTFCHDCRDRFRQLRGIRLESVQYGRVLVPLQLTADQSAICRVDRPTESYTAAVPLLHLEQIIDDPRWSADKAPVRGDDYRPVRNDVAYFYDGRLAVVESVGDRYVTGTLYRPGSNPRAFQYIPAQFKIMADNVFVRVESSARPVQFRPVPRGTIDASLLSDMVDDLGARPGAPVLVDVNGILHALTNVRLTSSGSVVADTARLASIEPDLTDLKVTAGDVIAALRSRNYPEALDRLRSSDFPTFATIADELARGNFCQQAVKDAVEALDTFIR